MLELCIKLSKLNRAHTFWYDSKASCIHTDCALEQVVCPKTWYIFNITSDGHATITNKHNTNNEHCESYSILQH